ncbi:MAG: helix-turn-helix transcriptional regulator [Candidatus Babeliales bacterium]|jgi:predicted transcriptional regulator
MNKNLSFKAYKQKKLKDKEFKSEYDALGPEFELLEQFIKARKKKHISQVELAKRLKAQQPSIARLERGGYTSTTVARLSKVADAMGYTLRFSLQAKKHI